MQDIDSLSKFRGHVECDFAYVPSCCQLALPSSAQTLSIFMSPSFHAHTPCASQTVCFEQVTKQRQHKRCTDRFENGSFHNAVVSGGSSLALWESVRKCHLPVCVGQRRPLPSLFRERAPELSLPKPFTRLKFRDKNVCWT